MHMDINITENSNIELWSAASMYVFAPQRNIEITLLKCLDILSSTKLEPTQYIFDTLLRPCVLLYTYMFRH